MCTASVNLPPPSSTPPLPPSRPLPSPAPLLLPPFQSTQVIPGLTRLAMKLLGPCTLIQAAIPEMMKIPTSYHKKNLALFEENAKLCYEGLKSARGLAPVMPAGAMYMMVHKTDSFSPSLSSCYCHCPSCWI